jgi:regulation of enolase protein 1 (concanavalin A-like superfamily)
MTETVPATGPTTVAPLPFPLRAEGPEPGCWQLTPEAVTALAPARTDMFLDPAVEPAARPDPLPDAPRLVGVPTGDFQLIAKVSVEFGSSFDAGVLLVHDGPDRWAKLCFEFTPQGRPSVVTVVTRGESDDANAFETEDRSVWLRVSRTGRAYAFHASTDREWWRMVRYFGLGEEPGTARVGFEAQSPMGEGCRVTFDDLEYRDHAPADLRDGS